VIATLQQLPLTF